MDKSRKITINNKSCIDTISSNIVTCLGLKSILYHKSYSISWVNTILIAIKEIYLFSIKFLGYHNKNWCDVNLVDV